MSKVKKRDSETIVSAVLSAIGYDAVNMNHIMLKARLGEPKAKQVLEQLINENAVMAAPPPRNVTSRGKDERIKAVYILTSHGKAKINIHLSP